MKNFSSNIIIRVFLVAGLATLLAFILIEGNSLFLPLVTGIALLICCIELIQYIHKSTRDVTHLLLSLRQNVYTDKLSATRGAVSPDLAEIVRDVTDEFARVSMERELHYQYLNALNENIGVGILSFDEKQKLLMANPAARSLLMIPRLSTLNDLSFIDSRLPMLMKTMTASDKEVIGVTIGNDRLDLSIQLKEIVLDNKPVRIYLLQNIHAELQSKELQAWQQLTRVLTHEIMNSVTPISSLSDAIRTILTGNKSPKTLSDLTQENVDDVHDAVVTISSRSKGLIKFVQAYKSFTTVPKVQLSTFDLGIMISRVTTLVAAEVQKLNINFTFERSKESVFVTGDEVLLEQVLLNLIKNAMEAVDHHGMGRVGIRFGKTSSHVFISVVDNGPGVEPGIIDEIFVPFFTTRKSGSGIGLSLSRQIMSLHRGSVKVTSKPGEGAIFTMSW